MTASGSGTIRPGILSRYQVTVERIMGPHLAGYMRTIGRLFGGDLSRRGEASLSGTMVPRDPWPLVHSGSVKGT